MRSLGVAVALSLLVLAAPATAGAPRAVAGSGSVTGSGWGVKDAPATFSLSVRGTSGYVVFRDPSAAVWFRSSRVTNVSYPTTQDPAPKVRVLIRGVGTTTGRRAAAGRVRMFVQVVDNPQRVHDDSFQITLEGRDRRGMTWTYMAGGYRLSGAGVNVTP